MNMLAVSLILLCVAYRTSRDASEKGARWCAIFCAALAAFGVVAAFAVRAAVGKQLAAAREWIPEPDAAGELMKTFDRFAAFTAAGVGVVALLLLIKALRGDAVARRASQIMAALWIVMLPVFAAVYSYFNVSMVFHLSPWIFSYAACGMLVLLLPMGASKMMDIKERRYLTESPGKG